MGVIISWLNSAVANVLFLTESFWLVFALLHKGFYEEQTKTMFKMFSKISFQKISCILSPLLCANRLPQSVWGNFCSNTQACKLWNTMTLPASHDRDRYSKQRKSKFEFQENWFVPYLIQYWLITKIQLKYLFNVNI